MRKKFKIPNYKIFEGCPKCGEFYFESNSDDYEIFFQEVEDTVAVTQIAHCLNCGHKFIYKDVYRFYDSYIKK